jgi:hypothetical protein
MAPCAVGDLFDEALRTCAERAPEPAPGHGAARQSDGFLYSGNRHESVPRRCSSTGA